MDIKDLLKEVIIPGVVAIGLVGTSCYMAIIGQEVPEWLYGFAGMAIGYYFSYASASYARRNS